MDKKQFENNLGFVLKVEVDGLPFDTRRRNIMRNTVFMVNMCFSGEYFEGDLDQALMNGIDELAIVKKWRKGATTEMKWKKMIEYIALSHLGYKLDPRL